MRRREFITLLGGAGAWPLAARAQQADMLPVVGLLRNTPSASFEHIVAALSRGLGEAGFVEQFNGTTSPRTKARPVLRVIEGGLSRA
jgi:putative ABC transport system substrate-binding protein